MFVCVSQHKIMHCSITCILTCRTHIQESTKQHLCLIIRHEVLSLTNDLTNC